MEFVVIVIVIIVILLLLINPTIGLISGLAALIWSNPTIVGAGDPIHICDRTNKINKSIIIDGLNVYSELFKVNRREMTRTDKQSINLYEVENIIRMAAKCTNHDIDIVFKNLSDRVDENNIPIEAINLRDLYNELDKFVNMRGIRLHLAYRAAVFGNKQYKERDDNLVTIIASENEESLIITNDEYRTYQDGLLPEEYDWYIITNEISKPKRVNPSDSQQHKESILSRKRNYRISGGETSKEPICFNILGESIVKVDQNTIIQDVIYLLQKGTYVATRRIQQAVYAVESNPDLKNSEDAIELRNLIKTRQIKL